MRKTTNVALIAMSAKPYHAGHHGMVVQAAYECDEVALYTSLTDRTSDGATITGAKMSNIWCEHIIPALPSNVRVYFVKNPAQAVVQMLLHSSMSVDYHVYCGDDRAHKYAMSSLPKDMQKFELHVADRSDIIASGTACRQALAGNRFDIFEQQMPRCLSAVKLWAILSS